jgi:transposase InsO family protein
MVVGHAFSALQSIYALTAALKEALLAYGIPKTLHVDNARYPSDLLIHSCALAGISLIHANPYDKLFSGKMEYFFKTVQKRFLSGVQQGISLNELNETFWLWLQHDYHHRVHRGIGEKPIDRYNASISRVLIRRLTKDELDKIFLIRHEPEVNNPT